VDISRSIVGRRLPAFATRLPTWWPYALFVAATSPLTLYWWDLIREGSVAFDWRIFVEAGQRIWDGSPDLYEVNELYSFRHSPVFALVMPAVAWIGTFGVRLVTLAAALAMPTWPTRVLAIASWPFAMDAQHGALIMPMVLAGAWALRGSRIGGLAFVVFTLLSPRPLMVPVAAYLVWRQPWLRLPAAALLVVNAAIVLASGYADDWISMLLTVGTDGIGTPLNLSPSRFIGRLWIPIGVLVAAWLTLRGRVGLAALAISPYLLPHYLLFALLDLRKAAPLDDEEREPVTSPGSSVG
jgi:hypothetical protein